MSFIPSFLKSIPQKVVFTFTAADLTIDVVITSVDLNYSVIMPGGCNGTDASGFVTGAIECAFKVLNATHARAYRNQANGGAQGNNMTAYATVLEFTPAMLLQPVTFFGSKSATFAHGLTLGPKAFLWFTGCNNSMPDSSGITQANDLMATARINGANVEIINSSGSGFGGDISFYIIDPR